MVSTGWERVTATEILQHRRQLRDDPAFNPDFDQLVDGRAVTGLDISLAEAKAIAAETPFSPKSRRAFVASGLPILGMARLMEAAAARGENREQVRVFHDFSEALKWLGLQSPIGSGTSD